MDINEMIGQIIPRYFDNDTQKASHDRGFKLTGAYLILITKTDV